MDFDETTLSIKVRITTIKMSETLNLEWEANDEEGEFEEDQYGVLGFVGVESGWLYAEAFCFTCGRKACGSECVCDEEERDWREAEYKGM